MRREIYAPWKKVGVASGNAGKREGIGETLRGKKGFGGLVQRYLGSAIEP